MNALALRPYQEASIDALLAPSDAWRNLLVLPTGAGKTVVFAAYLARVLGLGQRALVLAHREELIAQAADKIRSFAPGLRVEIEQGDARAERAPGLFRDERPSVVVGSVQSLHERRASTFDDAEFAAIVVDEAHHATATTYTKLFERFGCMDAERRTPLVGVTATPNRSDGSGLGGVFQRIAFELPLRELILQGHLVPIKAHRITTEVDLSHVKTSAGDFAIGELSEAVNIPARNALILAAYEKYAAGRKAIVFGASVQHARDLADAFSSRGHRAEALWGAMPGDLRRGARDRFSTGVTQVLTNFGIATEGFDEPTIACVILARPTKSTLLLTQMVGRGTRLAPGKEDVLVLDIEDVTVGKSIASVASLAGLRPKFDAKGRDVFAVAAQMEMLDPRLAAALPDADAVAAAIARMERGLTAAEVDLLAAIAPDADAARLSRFLWVKDADGYAMRAGDSTWHLTSDILDRWSVVVATVRGRAALATELSDLGAAFALADARITDENGERLALLDRDARWRSAEPSQKQLDCLVRFGIFAPYEIPVGLTKGQASQLLDEAFAKRKKRGAA